MAEEKDHAGSGGRQRFEKIDQITEEMERGSPRSRKFPRGRTGESKVKSPKKWPAPKNKHEGSEGEKAYGTPMDSPEDRGKKKEK